MSSLGLMPFFIEFLKTSGLFDQWVEDCPLRYTSPNAPHKRDVLGTLVLSVLAGHWRYAHISGIRGDGINPALLGMSGVASEDSVRRGMKAMDETASGEWMKKHLKCSYEPLLQEPWVFNQARATLARISQLLCGEYSDGVGHGGTSGEPDGSVVCATGTVGISGRTIGGRPAGVFARGQSLGSGEGDGGSHWCPK